MASDHDVARRATAAKLLLDRADRRGDLAVIAKCQLAITDHDSLDAAAARGLQPPWALLVSSDMETAAERLLAAIQATTTDDVNPFSRLRLIVEPRLTNTTRWYLVANPAEVDGLEYAYLAGAPGPQTETQVGFRIDAALAARAVRASCRSPRSPGERLL